MDNMVSVILVGDGREGMDTPLHLFSKASEHVIGEYCQAILDTNS